jgi:hypothetical protein
MTRLDAYFQGIDFEDLRKAGFLQPHQVSWAAFQRGQGRMMTVKVNFNLERIFL